MAVPSLPAAKNTGDVIDNSWVDAVRDLQQFFRDDRPAFKMTIDASGAGAGGDMDALSNATTTDIEWSDGSSSFNSTPSINVGGWSAAGSGNPEIIVPETGVYQLNASCLWASDTTGYRMIRITDAGTVIAGLQVRADAAITTHGQAVSGLHFFTANDRLGLEAYQNSGGAINADFWISAHWVGSSTS